MAGLCEGGNEPPGSLKACKSGEFRLNRDPWQICRGVTPLAAQVEEVENVGLLGRAAKFVFRAAKFVKGKREDGSDTIKELKWETLENRRRKTRITSLYRAHLGQKAWVDITARLEKPTYYGRNDHDFKIICRKQKTDVVKRVSAAPAFPLIGSRPHVPRWRASAWLTRADLRMQLIAARDVLSLFQRSELWNHLLQNIERELILKLTFEYAIRKVQDDREVLELNGLHQLLVYADDVNMLGENPQTIRENTGILLEASKEIGLEVNPEKTKYMIMSRDENIVRNGNIKIGNLSFEELEKFKYLGATTGMPWPLATVFVLKSTLGRVEPLNLSTRNWELTSSGIIRYGCALLRRDFAPHLIVLSQLSSLIVAADGSHSFVQWSDVGMCGVAAYVLGSNNRLESQTGKNRWNRRLGRIVNSLTIQKNSWNHRLGRIVNSLTIQKNSWNRRLRRIVNSLTIQKNGWNRRLGRIVNSLTIQKNSWKRRLGRIVNSLTIQKNSWNRRLRRIVNSDDSKNRWNRRLGRIVNSLTIQKNSWNRRLGRIVNSLTIQKNSWNRRLRRIVNSLTIQKNSWNRRLGRIVNSLMIQKNSWNRRLGRIVNSLTIQKNSWNRRLGRIVNSLTIQKNRLESQTEKNRELVDDSKE
ncbi:hypothetical protein ANN_05812 [Periplaneta americana]|uniref:Reverse transcriptase domain-containing protein n=1 Tax=Periplaneta americana TaxID=6978 RepID=A0ABQ8TCQ9_PERAM|nr:hypothetical protein ANN_05812 [Periplaneta americana]